MKGTWADTYLDYLSDLDENMLSLPAGFQAMNPYRNEEVWHSVQRFYKKFYTDTDQRTLLFGINPGRLGAGATGIPFTDTRHLAQDCGIEGIPFNTHEPSSVFVYDVIRAFGGPHEFYRHFLITSLSPLGFVKEGKGGKQVNINYYDDSELLKSTEEFIRENMRWHAGQNVNRNQAFCLGTGKNFKHFERLNEELNLFQELIPLEHPRFLMQYKFKSKDSYISKYLDAFSRVAY